MIEKELRLSLICYGGVSLAVYMHGVTKEIWHVLRASRAFHDENSQHTVSEKIYLDILQDIENDSGLKLRVLTDIIAGSSAGGINGIFLSKAITTGQSLEPLTDLWLEGADIDKLLDPDARPISRFSKFWATPLVWAVLRRKGGAVEKSVSKEKRSEVALKLSRLIRARWFAPPFGGTQFTTMLVDAVNAMDNAPSEKPLLPNGQPLDLFITVTDFRGHCENLRLNSPAVVSESEHRLTLHFSSCDSNTCPTQAQHIAQGPELVFAARATASFPGAFPPFSVRELDRVLTFKGQEWNNRNNFLERIFPYQSNLKDAEDTVLIDGSVLNNAPFKQAIGVLRNRPARREVDRRFVYIDPSPSPPAPHEKEDNKVPKKLPGFFSTIFGASSNIPRSQPIRDSLEEIQSKSDRILRMRMITDHLNVEVEEQIEAMLGKTFLLSRPTPKRITKWRLSAHQKSAAYSGFSFAAYGHLKTAGIVDDILALIRRTSTETSPNFYNELKDSIWQELDNRGLNIMAAPKGGGVTKTAFTFFKDHDLRFRIRRMRFLARRLAIEIENDDNFADHGNDIMHDAIYDCLALYLDRESTQFHGEKFSELVKRPVNAIGNIIDILAQNRNLENLDITVEGGDYFNKIPKSKKQPKKEQNLDDVPRA